MQSVADTHDTPLTPPFNGVIDHFTPFHCSPSGALGKVDPWVTPQTVPTAMHAVADAHDTAVSMAPPAGVGDGTSDQADPFQCSTSVALFFASRPPTAVQSVADTHETPNSPSRFDGEGEGTVDHAVPFQCCTSVPLKSAPPTAVQSVADTHDTPASSLVPLFGLGEGTIDHPLPLAARDPAARGKARIGAAPATCAATTTAATATPTKVTRARNSGRLGPDTLAPFAVRLRVPHPQPPPCLANGYWPTAVPAV